MSCNFEPNFVEKFLWERGYSIFGHVTFSWSKNSFFGRHFENVQSLIYLFIFDFLLEYGNNKCMYVYMVLK